MSMGFILPETAAGIINEYLPPEPGEESKKWTAQGVRIWMQRGMFNPPIGVAEKKERWKYRIRQESVELWIVIEAGRRRKTKAGLKKLLEEAKRRRDVLEKIISIAEKEGA